MNWMLFWSEREREEEIQLRSIGAMVWAISGGHIPLNSSGHEPEFTSRDELKLLNTNDKDVHCEIEVYYSGGRGVKMRPLMVGAKRLRVLRLNDLIDPVPVPLGKDYGCVVRCEMPLVVQFSRLDSTTIKRAITGCVPFSQ
ncbi:hypothetical protein CHISP_3021 [Chitinispirillum alkaliphilum]|nr:hypothetical protein CHISP_3021 [Chitinispirillum alkaliphilum]